MRTDPVTVVGGGLAGAECAWALGRAGVPVTLVEMRPGVPGPVHTGGDLAELVCSNSLKSDDPTHPSGILKREMEALGSLILSQARAARIPAGGALAVDRGAFAHGVTEALAALPSVRLERREADALPEGDAVAATGPLTSDAFAHALSAVVPRDLYFYDAVSPVVALDSLDTSRMFFGNRYGKGEGEDYLNIPLSGEQYAAFVAALTGAETVPLPAHEKALFFEGCLPVEEMARRGPDTLAYGPLKPVGLDRRAAAVVQLRQEDLDRTAFSLVGFQTRLKRSEQERVFRSLPGMEGARFLRHGQVHRNTYVNAPLHMTADLRLISRPSLRLAGQITGVEGYIESAATGLLAGLFVLMERRSLEPVPPPDGTALFGLIRHLTQSEPARFVPSNITFGLIGEGSRSRRRELAERNTGLIRRWAAETLPESFGDSSAGLDPQ
jgi:methylenetetrahydrofolate--tRNA-(uracil-5-)-methyltransferase